MKRLSYLLFVFVILLSLLAGCSGSSDKDKESTSTKSTDKISETEVSATSTPVAKKLGGEISYMTWAFNTEKNFPQSQMELFNKIHPDVKVNVGTFSGVDEYLKAQKVRLMSNDGVDVMALRSESLSDYVKSGYLEDLTGKPFLKNFNEEYFKQFSVDGKVYSIPGTLDLIGVWYNKDLFKKLNLSVPKTWTAFLDACEKIKASGVNPLMNGGKDSWPMEFDVYPFIQSIYVKDPDIFTKLDKGEAKYTDPQWIDAFQKIIDFYKKGYVAKECLAMGFDQSAQLFDQGKTAMLIQGEWAGQALVDATKKPTFDYGVFALPHSDEEIVVPVSIGSTIGVNAKSKNKEAAMALLEFLASDLESSKLMNASSGNFSPVKGMPIGDKPAAADWQELLKMKSNNFWYNVQYTGANAEILKQFQTAFAGKTNAQDMAKAMQAVQDKKTK